MTRLSEALRRAAEEGAVSAPQARDENVAPTTWEFSPVETMHVPVEPPPAPAVRATPEQVTESFAAASAPVAVAPEPPPAVAIPAVLPSIKLGDADRDKIVIGDGFDPALMEQYRHLAAVLHHAQKSSGARSVMVTSALPSEGKTLTATNLALTLSQSYQRRVLLIDADLRRPRMREMFALPATEGLTDSLMTPRTDGRLPVHQISPTLWVLTSGSAVPDPMSLLVSPSMRQLLGEARESFDWVVVDTPPIGLLPDANLLSEMIDTALLVVSAQSTPYPMVQRAATAVGTNRILGVVLNRAEKAATSNNFGYYGYNAYHAGHPKPDVKRRRWFGWLRRGSVPHVQ